tara:strand:- start:17074 stop:17535 length:462 start_codon:yes stop_codon:yes gene_type:complete
MPVDIDATREQLSDSKGSKRASACKIAVVDKARNYQKIPDEARECLDMLIAAGANADARTSNGRNSLFFVADLKMAKELSKAGAQVNIQDDEGWTPLHGIVHQGKVPIAKLFVKEGADVNIENAKGKPPFSMLAANRKKMEAVLVENGAKPWP